MIPFTTLLQKEHARWSDGHPLRMCSPPDSGGSKMNRRNFLSSGLALTGATSLSNSCSVRRPTTRGKQTW